MIFDKRTTPPATFFILSLYFFDFLNNIQYGLNLFDLFVQRPVPTGVDNTSTKYTYFLYSSITTTPQTLQRSSYLQTANLISYMSNARAAARTVLVTSMALERAENPAEKVHSSGMLSDK